jgi:dTDP-4-dehydrorhamnose 3,5-epimerase
MDTIDPRYIGDIQESSATTPIEGVVVTELTTNVDDRQSLTVYVKRSDPFFRGFEQSYVAVTAKGVVKAWHYHLRQTDIWFVPRGKIKVGLFDARAQSPTLGTANSVIMGGGRNIALAIPPGVFHGYVSLADSSILINTTDQPYDPADEYRTPWDDPRFGFSWDVENR